MDLHSVRVRAIEGIEKVVGHSSVSYVHKHEQPWSYRMRLKHALFAHSAHKYAGMRSTRRRDGTTQHTNPRRPPSTTTHHTHTRYLSLTGAPASHHGNWLRRLLTEHLLKVVQGRLDNVVVALSLELHCVRTAYDAD